MHSEQHFEKRTRIAVNAALHLRPVIHFMFCAVPRKHLFSHLFNTATGGPEPSVVSCIGLL